MTVARIAARLGPIPRGHRAPCRESFTSSRGEPAARAAEAGTAGQLVRPASVPDPALPVGASWERAGAAGGSLEPARGCAQAGGVSAACVGPSEDAGSVLPRALGAGPSRSALWRAAGTAPWWPAGGCSTSSPCEAAGALGVGAPPARVRVPERSSGPGGSSRLFFLCFNAEGDQEAGVWASWPTDWGTVWGRFCLFCLSFFTCQMELTPLALPSSGGSAASGGRSRVLCKCSSPGGRLAGWGLGPPPLPACTANPRPLPPYFQGLGNVHK